MRKLRERFLGRRIDDVLALAAGAVEPLAVDVKTELCVHGALVFWWFLVAEGIAFLGALGDS
jgi:hypothetical protein